VVVRVDGVLWEPKPGSVVSAEEFLRARSLVTDVHHAMLWNPWVVQDRAAEYEAAWKVMGQWRRADPDHRQLTVEEAVAVHELRMAEADARFEAGERQAEHDRAARAASFDPERAQARLALLEERAMLADRLSEREDIQRSAACLPERQYRARIAAVNRKIASLEQEVDRLAGVVGDEEMVADARGWLPAERREQALTLFTSDRIAEVRKLRARVAARLADLTAAAGNAEQATVREALRKDTCRLEYLEAIPPMTAADMCSECATPARWHAVASTYGDQGEISWPCDAWPKRAATRRAFRQELARLLTQPAAPPPPPTPRPLAVISPGVPIEDMMAQLTAIQAEHPAAIIRQGGSRKRWEIWPNDQTQD
jgi:hypothetical protein